MSMQDHTPSGTGRPDEDVTPEQDLTDGNTGVPNPETGVGLGAGEESTFEPEEDPEAAPDATPEDDDS